MENRKITYSRSFWDSMNENDKHEFIMASMKIQETLKKYNMPFVPAYHVTAFLPLSWQYQEDNAKALACFNEYVNQ